MGGVASLPPPAVPLTTGHVMKVGSAIGRLDHVMTFPGVKGVNGLKGLHISQLLPPGYPILVLFI